MSETQGPECRALIKKIRFTLHSMTCTLRDHRNKVKMLKTQVDFISQSTVCRLSWAELFKTGSR